MLRLSHRTQLTLLATISCASVARAHEAPAEPPLYEEGPCVELVDADLEEQLSIRYTVAFDDTELGVGDLPVYDAKRHQFFAMRGALHPLGPNLRLYPFERDATPLTLPIWITHQDVERAVEAASSYRDAGVELRASDVPGSAVLEHSDQLSEHAVRITPDDARVPITLMQGELGASWPLAEVHAGLYSIVAYIWSPPYNGWAARPGLVSVTRGAERTPAVVVSSIAGPLFAYQGRRVRLCTSVPRDTTLRGELLIEGGDTWQAWLDERPIEHEQLELCFRNPDPARAGAVRLRFFLRAPSGSEVTVYSPDTLTALPGQGTCVEDDSHCCDDAPELLPDAGTTACAGQSGCEEPVTQNPGASHEPKQATGCSVTIGVAASRSPWLSSLLGLACLGCVRGRRRRHCYSRAHPA